MPSSAAIRVRTPRWALICAALVLLGGAIDVGVTASLWAAARASGAPDLLAEANPLQRGALEAGGEGLPLALRLLTAGLGAGLIVVAARRGSKIVRPLGLALGVASLAFAAWELSCLGGVAAVQHENAVAQRMIASECQFVHSVDRVITAEGRAIPLAARPFCGSEAQVVAEGS